MYLLNQLLPIRQLQQMFLILQIKHSQHNYEYFIPLFRQINTIPYIPVQISRLFVYGTERVRFEICIQIFFWFSYVLVYNVCWIDLGQFQASLC